MAACSNLYRSPSRNSQSCLSSSVDDVVSAKRWNSPATAAGTPCPLTTSPEGSCTDLSGCCAGLGALVFLQTSGSEGCLACSTLTASCSSRRRHFRHSFRAARSLTTSPLSPLARSAGIFLAARRSSLSLNHCALRWAASSVSGPVAAAPCRATGCSARLATGVSTSHTKACINSLPFSAAIARPKLTASSADSRKFSVFSAVGSLHLRVVGCAGGVIPGGHRWAST